MNSKDTRMDNISIIANELKRKEDILVRLCYMTGALNIDTLEDKIAELMSNVKQYAISNKQTAIAAAVQAEREACAKVAQSANVRHGLTMAEIATGDQVAASIAAAIRARSNGNGSK